MNIDEIRKGNYLLHNNIIVKVSKVDIANRHIYIKDRPAPIPLTAFKSVKFEQIIKGKIVNQNFGSNVDEILLSLLFDEDLPLHTFQNELLDNYKKHLKIDDSMMVDLQRTQWNLRTC